MLGVDDGAGVDGVDDGAGVDGVEYPPPVAGVVLGVLTDGVDGELVGVVE